MSNDTIAVFGALFSPFVRKVHMVAEEKGIAVKSLPGNGPAASADFLAASPFRKIPAMQHGDYALADSTAIAMYLDALHPEPAIYPAQPRARGRAVFFEEFADTILVPAGGKVVFNRFVGPKLLGLPGDEAVALAGEAELVPVLAYLESQAPAQGWLAGGALIYLEHPRQSALPALPPAWQPLRQGTAGAVGYDLYERP